MKLLEEELLAEIERASQSREIIAAAKYLNKIYNLFSTDPILWEEVRTAFNRKHEQLFDKYCEKLIANKLINLLLLKYYPCERTVKHALIDTLKNKPDTVLFEMPVLGSRVDIGRINGNSYAYEIKTELDSLKRIRKQISDYSHVYEYINLVIAPFFYDEVVESVPEYCGITIYYHDKNSGKISFIKRRSAKKNPNICPQSQLECLSQQMLLSILKDNKKIMDIPATKEEKIKLIMTIYASRTINSKFKSLIKQMYANNWEFIRENYTSILPIDVQAFFNSPIDPKLIYLKQ